MDKNYINLPRTHRRFSDDDSFLDASVKLSKRLFDSGFTKQQVSAETLRQKANVLRYKLSVNQALFEALSIGYNVLNLKQDIKKLDDALDKLKEYRLIRGKTIFIRDRNFLKYKRARPSRYRPHK